MRKKIYQEETQQECLQAAEPGMAYGLEADSNPIAFPINHITEPFKTDEFGRIILSEEMKEAVSKAEQNLAEGTCITEDMFQKRFAKWL